MAIKGSYLSNYTLKKDGSLDELWNKYKMQNLEKNVIILEIDGYDVR